MLRIGASLRNSAPIGWGFGYLLPAQTIVVEGTLCLQRKMGLEKRQGAIEFALLDVVQFDNALVAHIGGADRAPADEEPLARARL